MSSPVAPRQLALALPHAESFAREDFLEGPSNAAALALIDRWPDWPSRVVALVGPEGAGKSHLAAIWANGAGARFLAGRALERAHVPGALATGALVVEDLTDGQFDERALFHLLNLARERRAYVLITTAVAVGELPIRTADLKSRLRLAPSVSLDPPDDALLRAVLVKLFIDRQLVVDTTVVDFLALRIERSLAAAAETVAALDREALSRGRRITRPMAAELVGRETGSVDAEAD